MKTLALLSAVGLALAIPTTSLAADSAERAAASRAGKVAGNAPRAINNQTAVACNWCFTCGGDWTVFSGIVRSSPASPTERGSGCSGSLIVRSDSSPFLCCR